MATVEKPKSAFEKFYDQFRDKFKDHSMFKVRF